MNPIPTNERLTNSFEMLIEGVRLEHVRDFLVHSLYYLVDCLLPRLLLVSFRIDCIEKVSQRFLHHLSEYLWKLCIIGSSGCCRRSIRDEWFWLLVALFCFINHSSLFYEKERIQLIDWIPLPRLSEQTRGAGPETSLRIRARESLESSSDSASGTENRRRTMFDPSF